MGNGNGEPLPREDHLQIAAASSCRAPRKGAAPAKGAGRLSVPGIGELGVDLVAGNGFLDDGWLEAVYATPEFIDTLDQVTPVRAHVPVDAELWGCPVNSTQVINALHACRNGTLPVVEHDKVCLECKRQQAVCVMVTRGLPCMGPVTRTGCGALCPGYGRDCYACYGPAENSENGTLRKHFARQGLDSKQIERRFTSFNSAADMTRQNLRKQDSGDD